MKFSEINVSEKIVFENGVAKRVKKTGSDEVAIYNMDYNRIIKLNDEVISKISEDDKDEELLYKMIPYLCNVEMDIDFEEFCNVLKLPSIEINSFIKLILELIDDLFNRKDNFDDLKNTVEEMKEKNTKKEKDKSRK